MATIDYNENIRLPFSRFFICWCIFYSADISIDRLIRRSHDLSLGHLLLPRDPGDMDPYLEGGIFLTVIGILAGVILALVYTVAFVLLDAVPAQRLKRPFCFPVLISAIIGIVLGIVIYRIWSGFTKDILFSYVAAGIGFVSAMISGWLAVHKDQHVLQDR